MTEIKIPYEFGEDDNSEWFKGELGHLSAYMGSDREGFPIQLLALAMEQNGIEELSVVVPDNNDPLSTKVMFTQTDESISLKLLKEE